MTTSMLMGRGYSTPPNLTIIWSPFRATSHGSQPAEGDMDDEATKLKSTYDMVAVAFLGLKYIKIIDYINIYIYIYINIG